MAGGFTGQLALSPAELSWVAACAAMTKGGGDAALAEAAPRVPKFSEGTVIMEVLGFARAQPNLRQTGPGQEKVLQSGFRRTCFFLPRLSLAWPSMRSLEPTTYVWSVILVSLMAINGGSVGSRKGLTQPTRATVTLVLPGYVFSCPKRVLSLRRQYRRETIVLFRP